MRDEAWSTQVGAWADWDLDGDLDLLVGNYGTFPAFAENTHPSRFYLNEGGVFSDHSHVLPPEVQGAYVFMAGWYDADRDGRPDLYSVHDYWAIAPSKLLISRDDGFVIDEESGFHNNFFGMGFAVTDLNGDAIPDPAQSGFYRFSLLQSGPGAGPSGVLYIEYADALGIELIRATGGGTPEQAFGWGMAFS